MRQSVWKKAEQVSEAINTAGKYHLVCTFHIIILFFIIAMTFIIIFNHLFIYFMVYS